MLVTNPADIATTEPILPIVPDATWEAEVRRAMGTVPDFLRRVSPKGSSKDYCYDFTWEFVSLAA